MEVGILLFELGFQLLDFFERARIGNGGADLVCVEWYPGTLFVCRVLAQIDHHQSQDFSSEGKRRTIKSTNALLLEPIRMVELFPLRI